jgi:hypothetical protein
MNFVRRFIRKMLSVLSPPDLDLERFEELERKKTFTNKGRQL